ncbi:amino acid ABC transporter permease [Mesorhizobium sp.]|uniref:amino acid ABC transporter permease n=1 Tax=Mesorhizobium sp. TaxID=1871066 RepID=UPI000FE5E76A|nr:amino acid ABC transporter permease [Mesorhizobium sp.]RWL09261.1 MAG: amino acid ABC transporter permease [Mesorhizobium sp.]
MIYQDTVESEVIVHKPWFVGSIFAVVFTLVFVLNLAGTAVVELMRPIIGDQLQGGLSDRFVISFIIAFLFCLNLVLIGYARLKVQIGIVWFQLLVLFLAFFDSFELSMPFIWKHLPYLVTQGVVTTIYVSAISLIFASIIAVVGAISKLSSNGFAYGIASFYTSFFRGLPALMQIYLIYLGLPQLGIVIDAVPAGVLALSLCYGAYMTEIFRSGIASIDRGQWEASRAMGFGFGLSMRKIVLPQALPVTIPPMGNMFISMVKDSSLVSVLGVWELSFLARTIGQPTFHVLEMLLSASLIYWILTILLELLQSRIELHYNKSKVK